MTLQPNTPVYYWSQLSVFRALVLSRGGSGDVSSGAEVLSDVDISGRYAREYSAKLSDLCGRTLTFYCSTRKPGEYGTQDYLPVVVLTGCPWGTPAERDATYRELALSGCCPNDMGGDVELLALVEHARGASGAAGA